MAGNYYPDFPHLQGGMKLAIQIALTIKKYHSALNAIRLIIFFNQRELLQLITSNFYSILFYNSEIWHLPSLNSNLKQKLLSASTKALKICWKKINNFFSFEALHKMSKRATPEKDMKYKLAFCLHKIYIINSNEFIRLNINQILSSRQEKFIASKSKNIKIGLNCLANRFYVLNGKIPLQWPNNLIETFKIKCKKLILG